MRVLVVTNMYPIEEEPQFGSFVKEQTEDLRQPRSGCRAFLLRRSPGLDEVRAAAPRFAGAWAEITSI